MFNSLHINRLVFTLKLVTTVQKKKKDILRLFYQNSVGKNKQKNKQT